MLQHYTKLQKSVGLGYLNVITTMWPTRQLPPQPLSSCCQNSSPNSTEKKNIESITLGDFKYTPVDTWTSCSSQVTWKAIPCLRNSAWHAWKMRGGTFSLMNNSSKLTSYSHTSWSPRSGWPHFCWRQWKRARLLEGSPAFLLPSLLTTWEQVLWFLTIIKQMHTLTQSSFSAPSTFSPSSSPWLLCSPSSPSWHQTFLKI